jgi:hypothetical protein
MKKLLIISTFLYFYMAFPALSQDDENSVSMLLTNDLVGQEVTLHLNWVQDTTLENSYNVRILKFNIVDSLVRSIEVQQLESNKN